MRVRNLNFSVLATLILCLCVLALCSGTPLWAQAANTGTVAGTVTDASGAVVDAATVTLTDIGTKSSRTATTNSAGRYLFADVPPGGYEISISKQGFSTSKTQATVTVGTAITVNIGLQVGGTNVVVEVTAVGTELQTMNATVGNTLTATALDNLPTIGRDVNTFIELQPGVSTEGSVGGAVNDQSFFSLDGGNNTNDMDGSGGVYTNRQQMLVIGDPTGGVGSSGLISYGQPSGVVPTPADSVEEFKVNSANQTADFNSSGGAEIKIVTKRGTDAYHGTAYEYYKDNNWSSNAWVSNWLNYLPGGHIGLTSYHYSRFGGAIGGPLIPKDVLGGKTYFFFNWEGFRYPNSEIVFRNVPSPALQQGLLLDDGPSSTVPNAPAAGTVDYNMNTTPVTYNGKTYPGGYGCPGSVCDPKLLGLNPLVSQIWSKYEPASNAPCFSGNDLCDANNILGFAGSLSLPIRSNFMVGRIDHDFSSKQHFMASYRYYNMKLTSDDQVDIGGFFPGDTKGVPASQSSDPVQDWYLVAGLTTNITNNTTNDFHYSFLRNWWSWNRAGAPPQISGLGGALEIMSGQTQTQDLAPFNSDNQQIRRRFWDGHDNMIRDDLSTLKGNHLFQFGGMYQHNFNYHQRNDSGGTINAFPVYSLGDGTSGSLLNDKTLTTAPGCITPGVTNSVGNAVNITNCSSLAAAQLGIVSIASQVFTRTGPNLVLNPPLSNAFDMSTIPYYNVYFSDTWHLKPSLTLTYGLGYALEMPPTEAEGKQTVLVDQSGEPLNTLDYLDARRKAAEQGQVYNPEIGFALVANTGGGRKYPYNPYYGEFSPRIAVAWNPQFDADSMAGKIFGHQDTVIRGGYGRQYGRLNGVDQVLVPLLGLGLEQPVACTTNVPTASGGWTCGATGAGTWATAFRMGSAASANGGPTVPLINLATPTLPQPVYPGFNNPVSASPEALDPNFRPTSIDSFDLTIQRQLSRRLTMELGYIGRRIENEYEPIMLNAVPYMMTMGGQTFANAYMNTVLQYCGGQAGLAGGGCAGSAGAVTAQPFFEASLKGTGYCNGFTSCTAAVVANEGLKGTGNLANAQVWSIWSDLDGGLVGCPATGCSNKNNPGAPDAFNFPRTMMNTPIPSTCNATTTIGCAGQYTSTAALNGSFGYGNYNAGFVSFKTADWRGLTMQSNFTWSKALGTGANAQASSELTTLDPFNLKQMYGVQGFDRRITYNAYFVYSPPFYKGQHGLVGRALGGWTFASIFTAGTGNPYQVATTKANYQSFGACDGIACADYDSENAVPMNGQSVHTSAHYCGIGAGNTSGIAACPGQAPGAGPPVNYFATGANDVMNWRNPILGLDTRDGGYGVFTGLSYWNMDFSIKKSIHVAETVNLEFQGVFANVLNHNQWTDNFPCLCFAPAFGSVGGGTGPLNVSGEAEPRNIEIGARVRF